jgi:DNA-directed RNA polymerase specialized sigma24 family protein
MFKNLFAISDEQAMWRVQTEDDHGAFALLVERWREKVRALCIRMTGNVPLGEDQAQDVFARVFEKRRELKGASKCSTWLWGEHHVGFSERRQTCERQQGQGADAAREEE